MAANAYTNNKNPMRFWKPKGWAEVMAEAKAKHPPSSHSKKAVAIPRHPNAPTQQGPSNGK